jgi:hypothetical protein
MDYSEKTLKELLLICKEKNIKGCSGKNKEHLIKKLNELNNNNTSIHKKKIKNNLYTYLLNYDSTIIDRFYGTIDEMMNISKGTMLKYNWKCINYEICKNIYTSRPIELYKEYRTKRIYCEKCSISYTVKHFQQLMLKKNGSLLDVYPNIINVWSNNNEYQPNELNVQSHKKVNLKCIKNPSHSEYSIYVYNIRETNCNICPKCNISTSKSEMRVYSELAYIFKETHWLKKINNAEADIIIDDIKLVIEVDGYPWHYTKNDRDLKKNKIFEINGYNVLRLRDIKLLPINCNNIICNISNFTIIDFNKVIEWININYNLKLEFITNFNNDKLYNELLNNILNVKYEDSLEYLFPESVNVWNYEKNNNFLPSQFTPGSHTEMWINCKNGHSYKAQIKQLFRIRIKDSTKRILNCPVCSNKIKLNKRQININGIIYKSITECCNKLNIIRRKLYSNMRKDKLDFSNIDNFEKTIIKMIYNNSNSG